MKPPTLTNIQNSQKEYLDLLLQHKEYVQGNDLSITRICSLLDEVKCFWLKRIKAIEFELGELTEYKTCFVLSGAIFLNVSEYEHYFFKSLGDCHILSDPFSKMEMIFRIPEKQINYDFTTDYFKRAFLDTVEVLTSYGHHFLILPIHEIAFEDPDKYREVLDLFFWRFISDTLNSEFKNNEEFCTKYESIEKIEVDLPHFVRDRLIFSDLDDNKLSLRERVERYSREQTNISSLPVNIPEALKFLIAVYSYVGQIAEILYTCSVLRVNPYIRFNVMFSYLTLVMYTFIEDKNLREMIEKALMSALNKG